MSSNPLVTIITANYNKGIYLERTLQSVTNQLYKNIEHIIIDDGSTDDSKKILLKYKKESPNVQIVLNKKNQKCVAKLRNQAVKASNGKYILNLDSDDILYCDAISSLVKMAESKKLDLCYGSMIYINEQNVSIRRNELKGSKYIPGKLIKGMYIPFPRMYKKEIFDKTNGYDETLKIADDWNLYLQIEELTNQINWIGKRPLFCYRVYTKSLSQSANKEEFSKERLKVYNNALKRRKSKRILIIGNNWNRSYIQSLRNQGNDVCTFFLNGVENLELEQFTFGKPYKEKNIYKIKMLSDLKKILIIKKKPIKEIIFKEKVPFKNILIIKIFFPLIKLKFDNFQ